MKTVLLTGAAGAAGARVLELLAERPEVARIYLLSQQGEAGPSRAPAAAKAGEVVPLAGNARLPRLGLDEKAFGEIAAAVDTIVHCAERAEIDQDLQAAREWNVQPVRGLIELLEKAGGARLVHLS